MTKQQDEQAPDKRLDARFKDWLNREDYGNPEQLRRAFDAGAECATILLQHQPTSERCEECDHTGPRDESGRCIVDVSAYSDPERGNQKWCMCKCVFPVAATVVQSREHDALADECQRRVDAVVEAAVEWHQSGREGDGSWFEKSEALSATVNSLLELRGIPAAKECFCGTELEAGLCPNGHDPVAPAAAGERQPGPCSWATPHVIHEDQLPPDLSRDDYDTWYALSWIQDGVRVGPRPPDAPTPATAAAGDEKP